jgi:hypothetical protein
LEGTKKQKETTQKSKVFQSKTESVLLLTHPDVRKYTQDFFYPLYRVCITQNARPVLRLIITTALYRLPVQGQERHPQNKTLDR